MIANNGITVYHKGFNETTRLETWTRYNYPNVWIFGGEGAGINKGYDQANNVQVRIPYNMNKVNIEDFSIGDIIVEGTLTTNIETQQDIKGLFYNITSINNNNFGKTPHIHLGGR